MVGYWIFWSSAATAYQIDGNEIAEGRLIRDPPKRRDHDNRRTSTCMLNEV